MRNRFKIICALLAVATIAFASSAVFQTSRAATIESILFSGLLTLAEKGDPEAQYHVGMLYNNGIGTSVDGAKAFAWFEKATQAGHPLGAFKLGCYYDGQFAGVVQIDHALGLKYKLLAADQGYDLAQSGVAQHYYASKNFTEAVRWWTMAAKQGETDAMHYLSDAYAHGEIAEIDLQLSYRYLDALKHLPEFSSDKWVNDALAALTKKMSADEVAAAKSAAAFVMEPTALTLKARAGISEAKRHLAANMQ